MRVRKRLKRGGLSPARLEITCDDRSSRRSSDACAADSAGAGVSIVGLAVICIGDRKSVVEGKRVDLGGGRIIKKKKKREVCATQILRVEVERRACAGRRRRVSLKTYVVKTDVTGRTETGYTRTDSWRMCNRRVS